jgi:hypothetical protein
LESIPQATPHNPELTIIWLCAAVVFVVLASLLGIAARQSAHGRGGVSIGFFLVVVALLPLWGSFLFIFLGSLQAQSSDNYWAAAPWLVIFATYKYSWMSVGVASITGLAFAATPGNRSRKFLAALVCFIVLAIAAATYFRMDWVKAEQQRAEERAEKKAAADFVAASPELAGEIPGPIIASVSSSRERDGVPFLYRVFAYSQRDPRTRAHVVVAVSHVDGVARFRFACILPEGADWSGNDPCVATGSGEPGGRRR